MYMCISVRMSILRTIGTEHVDDHDCQYDADMRLRMMMWRREHAHLFEPCDLCSNSTASTHNACVKLALRANPNPTIEGLDLC